MDSSFPVIGMTCASCAINVEKALKSQPGVAAAAVNLVNAEASVSFDPAIVTPQALQQLIRSIGYDLLVDTDEEPDLKDTLQLQRMTRLKNRMIVAMVFALPVAVIGMFFHHLPYGSWWMLALTIPVVGWSGSLFFVNAFRQLRHRQFSMDSLVALSSGIAFLFSLFNTLYPEYWISRGLEPHVYYEAAAVVIAFVLLGKFLEEKAKAGTASAIKKLLSLQPATATLIDAADKTTTVPVAQIKAGDLLLIRPGESLPVDGTVTEGSSYVDESMISGEPVPVLKGAGDYVYAGTLNQQGSFRFTAEKTASQTLLARIIKKVKEAQGSKAPVQQLVDKIAGVFVPVVIGIAILSFITWNIFGGQYAFTHGLLAMVTVLVIACPCALGLATPTAIMTGIGKGASIGVLIKDAESLERAHQVNAIIMDKTGTITYGKPVVKEMVLAPAATGREDEIYGAFLALEKRSEHPLAEAVVHYLSPMGISSMHISKFESITGKGVKARTDTHFYFAGNESLLKENAVLLPAALSAKAAEWRQQGSTVIWLADHAAALAVTCISDTVRPETTAAIKSLKDMGIAVFLVTGDNLQTAQSVAQEVGISDVKAGILPQGKADLVQQLQAGGKVVAVVGDGINDSQAMAVADVSMAMGKGSDIAIETSKMTLMSSDLQVIPRALRLSKMTVVTIRQNLFWAFIYNIIGIPLAAGLLYPVNGFLLNPMIAGAAMALSSISVVVNSLRLKWRKC